MNGKILNVINSLPVRPEPRRRVNGGFSAESFFESPDEFVGFFGAVVGDKIPEFFDVSFRCERDSNAKLCGHL